MGGSREMVDESIEERDSFILPPSSLAVCLVSGGMVVGSGWVAAKDRLFPPHRIQGEAFVCNTSAVPLGGTHPFSVPGSKTPFMLIHLNDGIDDELILFDPRRVPALRDDDLMTRLRRFVELLFRGGRQLQELTTQLEHAATFARGSSRYETGFPRS